METQIPKFSATIAHPGDTLILSFQGIVFPEYLEEVSRRIAKMTGCLVIALYCGRRYS